MAEPLDPCPDQLERLSAALDGALPGGEARALEAHVAGCPGCRAHRTRLGRVVDAVRAHGPLVPLAGAALAAHLAALEARLSVDAGPELLPAADDAPSPPPPVVPQEPAGRPILWGESAWQLLRLGAALTLVVVGALLLQAKWAQLQAPPERPQQPITLPPGPATEAPPPPIAEDPPAPPDDAPPPDAPPDEAPPRDPDDLDPTVQPIPPEPPPPGPIVVPPREAPDPTDLTRVREPRPDGAPDASAPEVQLAQGADVERLIASIVDRATDPQQRLSQLRSLGDPRFRQRLAYEFLAAVLLDGALDRHPLPDDLRRAACGALGALGTDAAAEVLVAALARPPARTPQRDADDAALCAALAALADDAGVDRLARALPRLGEDRGLLALRALTAGRRGPRPGGGADPAVDGLIELYGSARATPAILREAGAVLGETGDPRALAAFAIAIAAGKTTAVRQGAALGLGALAAADPTQAPACLDGLGEALRRAEKDDPGLALACVRGLRRTGARGALPLLIELTDPKVERRAPVRGLAVEALVALTGQLHADAEAWRTWWRGDPTLPRPGALRPLAEAAGLVQFFRLPALAEGAVFVVDVSGSMAHDGRWERARAELRRAIEPMTPRTRFQVLFFRDAPVPVFRGGLAPATDENKARALRALEQQRPLAAAQTAIGRALEDALDLGAEAIYFVSDGIDAAQDDAALRLRVARKNALRAVPARIHTVLVREGAQEVSLDEGPDDPAAPIDVRLMRGLARDSGGVFVRNGRL